MILLDPNNPIVAHPRNSILMFLGVAAIVYLVIKIIDSRHDDDK